MQPVYIITEIFCFFFHAESSKFSVNFTFTTCFILNAPCVCWTPPPHLELQLLVLSCPFPAYSHIHLLGFLFTTVLFAVEALHMLFCLIHLHLVTQYSHLSLNFQGSPSMNFTSESSMMVSLSTCPSVGTHFNLSL